MRGQLSIERAGPAVHRDIHGECIATSGARPILVVEDDPTNRRVISSMLTRLGYQCEMVTNGREAVEACARTAYSAVLMDCLMPVMDGYDATRTIRDHETDLAVQTGSSRRVPIIAVTALSIQGARDRCLAAGMDDYLTKPVVLERLTRVLDRWIANAAPDAARSGHVPHAPADTDNGPIDYQILNELRALGDEDGPALIAELVHDFGVEVPGRFPAMHAAVADGQTQVLLHELHFIAGCASIVGARHVERLARSINARSGPVDLDAAAGIVNRLEAAYRQAYASLQAIANAG